MKPIESHAHMAFNALNKLHYELHREGRIAERDDATAMAMRVRRIALGEPPIVQDPRPSDPAELAKAVAAELRKRGIWAHVDPRIGPVVYVSAAYPMFRNDFDNLGPVAIADEIQAAEVRRAQEWAGDPPC